MAFHCKHYSSKDGMCTCSFLKNEFGNFPRCNMVPKDECVEKKAYLIAQSIGKCLNCSHLVSTDLTPESQDCFCRYYPCAFLSNDARKECSVPTKRKHPEWDLLVWFVEFAAGKNDFWTCTILLGPFFVTAFLYMCSVIRGLPAWLDFLIIFGSFLMPTVLLVLAVFYVDWRYHEYAVEKGWVQ